MDKLPEPYDPYDVYPRKQALALASLLESRGYDLTTQHSEMTPYRLLHYFSYWRRPEKEVRMTCFDNANKIDQSIVIDPVPFWACCSHHLLPFFGNVYFGYIPTKKLIGLSMVPLMIQEFCSRPWLQEDMTKGLADKFWQALKPLALGIVTIATHTCQMLDLEGPTVPRMKLSDLRGAYFEKPASRDEFLRLAGL